MASFLQNNGDIILDAVLTDYGRKLLAKGDGSFNIVKFAFGDDEIDYSLFNSDLETSQQDARIMQTPILEAFTNNAASMKSQLLTIGIENLLFLPVLKLNNKFAYSSIRDFNGKFTGFVVPVDTSINLSTQALTSNDASGVLSEGNYIIVDQGMDSEKFNPADKLKTNYPALYESEYNVFVDNRFCTIDGIDAPISVDDDGVAIYKLTEQTLVNNVSLVKPIEYKESEKGFNVISGAKGSRVQFRIIPGANLLVDTYFDKYGKELELVNSTTFKTLRMSVKIVGITTGYSVEIPVMFAKVKV